MMPNNADRTIQEKCKTSPTIKMEKRLAHLILQCGISNITIIEIVCKNIYNTILGPLIELVVMARIYLLLSIARAEPER